MPSGYLAGVAVLTAMTLIALAPPRLPGLPGAVTYRLGLVVSELPFVFLALHAAATVLTVAGHGGLRSPADGPIVAAAVLPTAGLAVVARRGFQARPVVHRALDEGLGTGWRRLPRRRFRYARILLWPFPTRPRAVARIRNLRYGPAGRRNRLDVFHHRSRPAGAPVLVYLHGGGYFSGSKNREARPLLHRLAGQGWVCLSATYRLRPRAAFPDHLVDAKQVIAWARAHAGRYGADPETVFVAGSSAGGHLATLAALTPNVPALQPGFADADTTVAGAISLYGYYGRYYDRDATEEIGSTPFAYPAAGAPPVFLAHGDRDTLVPVEQARRLAERLRSGSAHPVVYAELPGGHHAFDLFHSARFEAVVDGVEAFTGRVRAHREDPTVQAGPE
ncbi:MAG TPA: alpha/beta hydrolase [Actinoplanes sp.]|nr:alpha/beta hydrolase [Actinoplanes sp.]